MSNSQFILQIMHTKLTKYNNKGSARIVQELLESRNKGSLRKIMTLGQAQGAD